MTAAETAKEDQSIAPQAEYAALHILLLDWKTRHLKGTITLHLDGTGAIKKMDQNFGQTPDEIINGHLRLVKT